MFQILKSTVYRRYRETLLSYIYLLFANYEVSKADVKVSNLVHCCDELEVFVSDPATSSDDQSPVRACKYDAGEAGKCFEHI